MLQEPLHNEKELLLRMSKGDADAFRTLFDAYRDKLYFFIVQIASSKEMAEDIVQDTFLKIWIMRDRLPEIRYFNTYLFRMAQNALLNGLKRKAAEAAIYHEKLPMPGVEATADELMHIRDVKKVIEEAVEGLPERQKMVFRLRREEGKNLKEIAAAMGTTEITVKGQLNKAQNAIREAIELNFPLDGAIILIIMGIFAGK